MRRGNAKQELIIMFSSNWIHKITIDRATFQEKKPLPVNCLSQLSRHITWGAVANEWMLHPALLTFMWEAAKGKRGKKKGTRERENTRENVLVGHLQLKMRRAETEKHYHHHYKQTILGWLAKQFDVSEEELLLLKLATLKSPWQNIHDSHNCEVKMISHLFAPMAQRDLEQSVCSLPQKVGVQHPYFIHISHPDLRRGLPEAFPALECTHKQRKDQRPSFVKLNRTKGQKKILKKGFLLAHWVHLHKQRCNGTYDSLMSGGN